MDLESIMLSEISQGEKDKFLLRVESNRQMSTQKEKKTQVQRTE